MSTAEQQHIIEASQAYARTYTFAGLNVPPSRKVAVITCMDARLNPQNAFGYEIGECTTIRNAGGSTLDAVRSILLTGHLLGIEEVYVVKHTRCGLLGATDEMVHTAMKANLGADKAAEVDNFEVLPIANLEQSARDDVEYLRNHSLAPSHVKVTGWIFDTDTGLVRKVVE